MDDINDEERTKKTKKPIKKKKTDFKTKH